MGFRYTLPHCLTALSVISLLTGCTASREDFSRYPAPIFDTKPLRPPPPPIARTLPPPPRPVTPPPVPPPPVRVLDRTVIVDAGHGGKDPGARGVGPLVEKHVNLAVANRVVALLEDAGARVIPTRGTDRFLTLDERANLADRFGVDLFVSIHADSAQNASASGSTLYIARNASAASERAGRSIEAALKRAGFSCRGVHRAGFRVLVGHRRPAVLVECGFLTNRVDANNLADPGYQQRIATAIARGILDHFGA